MAVRREYRPSKPLTDAEREELRATREYYQRTKPSLEQVAAEPGAVIMTMGEYMMLRQLRYALKVEREKQHLSLADLEERTGIPQADLSEFENGRGPNTTLSTVYRISAALGKQFAYELQDAPASA